MIITCRVCLFLKICLWWWQDNTISVTHVLIQWRAVLKACSLMISLFFSLCVFFCMLLSSTLALYYSLSNKVIVRWENEIKKGGRVKKWLNSFFFCNMFSTLKLSRFRIKEKKKRKKKTCSMLLFQIRSIKQNKSAYIRCT